MPNLASRIFTTIAVNDGEELCGSASIRGGKLSARRAERRKWFRDLIVHFVVRFRVREVYVNSIQLALRS